MSVNFTDIYEALYERVTEHADGAAVRALVGSIFPAKDLGSLSGKTLPYLVWRYLDPDLQAHEMGNVNAGWYAYIAPNGSERTLTTIATAVYNLYRTPLAIDYGRLGVLAPRAPFFDEALTLRGIHIPFYWRTLG